MHVQFLYPSPRILNKKKSGIRERYHRPVEYFKCHDDFARDLYDPLTNMSCLYFCWTNHLPLNGVVCTWKFRKTMRKPLSVHIFRSSCLMMTARPAIAPATSGHHCCYLITSLKSKKLSRDWKSNRKQSAQGIWHIFLYLIGNPACVVVGVPYCTVLHQ